MSGRARGGHKAERKPREKDAAAQVGSTRLAPLDELISGKPEIRPAHAEQNPLDFALSFMRDDSKPDALRVSVAKAALPYLHTRGEETDSTEPESKSGRKSEPKSERMSDLEAARRIAHILLLGEKQEQREAGGALHARTPPGALRAPPSPEGEGERKSRAAVMLPPEDVPGEVSPNDEPVQRSTEPDPHPGYRWIP